jgi:hypothetical protein
MTLGKTARICALTAALLSAGGLTGPAAADVSDFLGDWHNVDSDTSGVTHIVVTPAGGNQVTIRVFGQCDPNDCDWGARPGHSYTENPSSHDVRSITAFFNAGFANKLIVLRRAPGGDMRFEVMTDFTDGSGREDYDMTGKLTLGGGGGGGGGGPGGGGGWPPPPGGGGGGWGGGPSLGPEDCISFDPSAVTAAHVGGAWKVVQGSMWMLDYGSNAVAAHRAADTIHHYHFDQQCFVRRPNASMMYWKTGGHVASGNMFGEDCIGLNPMNVSVAHAGGAWKVVDGGNWLLDYGSDHAAADQALAVIQTYHLNRQCFIVRPNASMQYWLAQ